MKQRIISPDDWSGTKAELQARVAAFAQAKADHASTEGVPAPFETDLVEQLYHSKDTFEMPPPPPPPAPRVPLPTPRIMTPREKLEAALGITVAELRAELAKP